MFWGEGGPTLGEWMVDIAGCHSRVHCSLLWFGTINFEGADGGRCWVPLQGAIGVLYGWRRHFLPDSDSYRGFTSNRAGGRRTTLVDGRGTRVPLHVVPLLCHRRVSLQCAMLRGEGEGQLWRSGRGAIAGWNCSMLWLWGEGEGHLYGVVPLLGAIKGCHSSVPWWGQGRVSHFWRSGRGAICIVQCWGDDQLWGSGCGAIARCHCSLLRFGGRGTNHFGCSGRGVRVLGGWPTAGEWTWCHLWGVDVVPLLAIRVPLRSGGEGDDQLCRVPL